MKTFMNSKDKRTGCWNLSFKEEQINCYFVYEPKQEMVLFFKENSHFAINLNKLKAQVQGPTHREEESSSGGEQPLLVAQRRAKQKASPILGEPQSGGGA